MRRSNNSDQTTSQGTIYNHVARVDYYITDPSPSECVAVGVVFWHGEDEEARRPRRMLVGKGRDEASAVADLKARFAAICQPEQPSADSTSQLPVSVQDSEQMLSQQATDGVVAETAAAREAEASRA